MSRKLKILGLGLALSLTTTAAWADFSPAFEMSMSDTKVKANPNVDIHLEFDEEDEEIGNFTLKLPAGFDIASDEEIEPTQNAAGQEEGEVIGGGTISIAAGFACRPGPEGAIPVKVQLENIEATLHERSRTDEEADSGVHAVWFLDLEPLNRVRLLISGSPTTGWTISGAPTPSDNTCNPLVVDLTINGKSESGVPVITNPAKAGKKVVVAEIQSQDSPTVATFKQVVKITK